jgi:hypothetical protein
MANNLNPIADSIQYFGSELLAQLKDNLVFASLVQTNYKGAAEAPGATVNVPFMSATGSASIRANGGAASASDVISGTIPITLQHILYGVVLDNLTQTFTNVDDMTRLARECSYKVAGKATDIIAGLWNHMPYEVGKTDGTASFNATDGVKALSQARKQLMLNQCPDITECNYVINPTEADNLRQLAVYQNSYQAGSADGLRTGALPSFFGIKGNESQRVANATASTAAQWGGAPLVNNAAGYAIGATSIAVDALGTGSIAAGSSFKLGSYQYSVTTTATITTNAATLSIYPALKEAVVDNQALTPTSHSAASSQNFVIHPSAIIAVARPVQGFSGASVLSQTFTDPDTGLGVRVSFADQLFGGANAAMSTQMVVDMVFGAEVVRPELAIRLTGQV